MVNAFAQDDVVAGLGLVQPFGQGARRGQAACCAAAGGTDVVRMVGRGDGDRSAGGGRGFHGDAVQWMAVGVGEGDAYVVGRTRFQPEEAAHEVGVADAGQGKPFGIRSIPARAIGNAGDGVPVGVVAGGDMDDDPHGVEGTVQLQRRCGPGRRRTRQQTPRYQGHQQDGGGSAYDSVPHASDCPMVPLSSQLRRTKPAIDGCCLTVCSSRVMPRCLVILSCSPAFAYVGRDRRKRRSFLCGFFAYRKIDNLGALCYTDVVSSGERVSSLAAQQPAGRNLRAG